MSAYQVAPYEALAPIYERVGLAEYARQAAPRLIGYAQTLDWAGRRVLDLGCATGASTWALAEMGFRVAGIDPRSALLAQAEARAPAGFSYTPPEFHAMDLRELVSPFGAADLALAVGGAINAQPSMRDAERVFAQVRAALDPGKLFLCDLRTIGGLAQEAERAPTALLDLDDLTLITRCQFSYETLSAARDYVIFEQAEGGWRRRDEHHVERGYPAQAIGALLARQGFEVIAQLGADLQPFDPQDDPYGRVIFVARAR